jgi:hypothetical protein
MDAGYDYVHSGLPIWFIALCAGWRQAALNLKSLEWGYLASVQYSDPSALKP